MVYSSLCELGALDPGRCCIATPTSHLFSSFLVAKTERKCAIKELAQATATNSHLAPTMTGDLETPPPRPPTLLRLPPPLRHCIYLYVDVTRHDGCPYTYYLNGRKESRGGVVSALDPPPASNFAGLLLACRTLYAEVATLFYSANQFVIFYYPKASLEPLQVLSPTVLASLTSLKIVLSESSCHEPTDSSNYPPPCCFDDLDGGPGKMSYHCAERHGSLHRPPLLDSSSSGVDSTSSKLAAQAILNKWHNAAVYVSTHVDAGRLALSLVCDIDHQHEYALEAGKLAVTPLGLFPPLKDCHVRLCKQWNRPLQQLAKSAVLQARANASPLPFRVAPTKVRSGLINLPRELRFLILEYTDLITPWNEVAWCREYPYYQVRRPPCLQYEGGCPPHIHHGCQLRQCSDDPDPCRFPPPVGCFCRRRHAAFSFTCNCWAPPTSLFLVCRLLYRDAQLVFFSGNRFVVHDVWATPSRAPSPIQDEPSTSTITRNKECYPYKRLAASDFLRNVVPADCLAHLRLLEIVFPPYLPHGWPLDEHPAMVDWRATVVWMRGKIDAPALTIRIVFADFLGEVVGRRELSQDQGMWIVRGYQRIIYPFRVLVRDDGLAGLYVQAAYPWRWTRNTIRFMKLRGNGNWLAETEQWLKEDLERLPGCEAIVDSRNKPEPRVSVWQRWSDVPMYSAPVGSA